MQKSIPVLFTKEKSNYYLQSIFDCYDQERNALNYNDLKAVIAHPPCRLWGRLRHLSTAPIKEKYLGIWAVNKVRSVGGVLEHPAGSQLFRFMDIPMNGSSDSYGGFLISINQHWFGFQAQKRTYLYIVGCSRSQLPRLPLSFNAVTHSVSSSPNFLELDKSKNSVTVPKLCDYLAQIQKIIESNKKSKFTSGENLELF